MARVTETTAKGSGSSNGHLIRVLISVNSHHIRSQNWAGMLSANLRQKWDEHGFNRFNVELMVLEANKQDAIRAVLAHPQEEMRVNSKTRFPSTTRCGSR
ncbi:hypothetical protein BLNAU_22881 [Blattamonas nauphoetae]|uniref:Uncharacterized protein n=1 Tax=Blattamonas nauphoetae TaxID=2049346 RepID=A0ABQ9WS95_9EUKA|nr:hypothetical protein BLNAU_22881 [Blattamonas nauphoetae]